MKLKSIVVEDEPLARAGLAAYIREIEFIELCTTCEDALQANQALATYRPDLMFLDIQMPKLTGIDFLQSLAKPPLVIFTTAYPHYALQGFELDVVDYLVKPYPFDRFLKAVNKARELYSYRQSPMDARNSSKDHFFVKTDHKLERIAFDTICYIEAMENYVAIHTNKGRIITMMTMTAMEALLPAQFLRIHKTYIVAINKVQAIQGNEVLVHEKWLPISRQKRTEVLEKLIG